jgi:hypothetical protein
MGFTLWLEESDAMQWQQSKGKRRGRGEGCDGGLKAQCPTD